MLTLRTCAYPYPGFRLRDAQRDSITTAGESPVHAGKGQRLQLLLVRAVVRARARISPSAQYETTAPQDQTARAREIEKLTSGARRVRWRSEYRIALDYEYSLLPVLEEFDPDIIHVHDVFMMGVAAKAAAAAAERGKSIKLVYDAREYLPGLAHVNARTVASYVDLEREYLRHFDAIVTVSDGLAEWLVRDYGLVQTPSLVYNAPAVGPAKGRATIREDLNLPDDVPIAVYAGGVNPERGVETAILALAHVPEVHLAVVAHANPKLVAHLNELARSTGVIDRFHIVPFVDAEDVVEYLSSATIGLSTLLRAPNHDIALTNKFCEYIQAGLLVVTSDTPTQQQITVKLGIGAVYRAGDPESLARAITDVLTRADEIRIRLADPALRKNFAWSTQAATLRDVYSSLLGTLPAEAYLPDATEISVITPKETRKR